VGVVHLPLRLAQVVVEAQVQLGPVRVHDDVLDALKRLQALLSGLLLVGLGLHRHLLFSFGSSPSVCTSRIVFAVSASFLRVRARTSSRSASRRSSSIGSSPPSACCSEPGNWPWIVAWISPITIPLSLAERCSLRCPR